MRQTDESSETNRLAFGSPVFMRGAEPMLQSVARTQQTISGFATRRMRAYQEMPRKALACKSPQDMASVQVQFWREASADYAEMFQRMAQLWSFAASAGGQDAPARDYIAVHDTAVARDPRAETAAPNDRQNTGNGRRNAA